MPPQDGFLIVDLAKFPEAFAADVDPMTIRFMAAGQVPWGLGAVTATASRIAWKAKPTQYMLATGDLMIPPSAQRKMAERMRSLSNLDVAKVEGRHVRASPGSGTFDTPFQDRA